MPYWSSHNKDTNEPAIVKELKSKGCSVLALSSRGFSIDLLVGYNGRNVLFEVKNPDLPPSKRRLTEKERDFIRTWKGEVYIIHTVYDVYTILGIRS